MLMGSVAENVLRTAPCPVVTVKTPLPGAEPRFAAEGSEMGHPGQLGPS